MTHARGERAWDSSFPSPESKFLWHSIFYGDGEEDEGESGSPVFEQLTKTCGGRGKLHAFMASIQT